MKWRTFLSTAVKNTEEISYRKCSFPNNYDNKIIEMASIIAKRNYIWGMWANALMIFFLTIEHRMKASVTSFNSEWQHYEYLYYGSKKSQMNDSSSISDWKSSWVELQNILEVYHIVLYSLVRIEHKMEFSRQFKTVFDDLVSQALLRGVVLNTKEFAWRF